MKIPTWLFHNIGDSKELSNFNLILYAKCLKYELNAEDCQEIRNTSHKGERVANAIQDFLSAYER